MTEERRWLFQQLRLPEGRKMDPHPGRCFCIRRLRRCTFDKVPKIENNYAHGSMKTIISTTFMEVDKQKQKNKA